MNFRSLTRTFILYVTAMMLFSCPENKGPAAPGPAKDPLPSWSEGDSKKAIIGFVEKICDTSGADYVRPEDRIATFDNDGTLWSEQPVYFQFRFAMDRIRAMADDDPGMMNDSLFAAVINNDMETVIASGMHGLLKLVMASHAGMTTEEFNGIVKQWTDTARHERFGRLYTEMVYQPMIELIIYLKENDFSVYIVSGGGMEFMRPWTEEVYGIPSQNVIGSSIEVEFNNDGAEPTLERQAEIHFIDDKEGKPVAIHRHIGKKPVMAFGNSDGDLQMLQWTASNELPNLPVYIHHTDEEREWAYDRESHIGKLDNGLDEAAQKGWAVVDMKNDWKVIYPFMMNGQ